MTVSFPFIYLFLEPRWKDDDLARVVAGIPLSYGLRWEPRFGRILKAGSRLGEIREYRGPGTIAQL
jgi:hypothetical protein